MASTTPRAVLHVGAPKTGTTYLQAVLWRNREQLRAAGILYPLTRQAEHFAAALDLREMSWGGRVDGPWVGAWAPLADRMRAWEGSVVLSNELLGGVTPEQARTVADAAAGPSGREVHVVFTARDLARQLPSDWQEHLKHRHDITLPAFVGDLVSLGLDAPAPFGELFWGLHDAERVLRTWGTVVPPEQLHLVALPQQATGPHDLWERFAAPAALPPLTLDLAVEPRNVSLGVVEAEFVRRLNTQLKGRLAHRHYDPLVRKVLAEDALVSSERAQSPSERPTLPAAYQQWVEQRSRQLIEAVEQAGYDVCGDLADLMPGTAPGGRQPEDVAADDLLPVALDGLVGVLRRLGDVTDQVRVVRELERRLAERDAEVADLRADRDYWRDGGVAHRLVRLSDRHAWMMPARRAYVGGKRLLRRGEGEAGAGD